MTTIKKKMCVHKMLTFMVSVFEAISTQGHTLGDTTCATSVCPKVSCPHQATESSAVKFSDITGKIVVRTTPFRKRNYLLFWKNVENI
jgi:hypothetical protein